MENALAIEDEDEGGSALHVLRLDKPRYVSSFEDYARIKEPCEVTDGEVFMMAAPTNAHQMIVLDIGSQFRNQLRGKRCRPFIAPADVELPSVEEKGVTIVQPDVFIVCDPKKINLDGHTVGAPDFVLEVLSPSTRTRDLFVKSYLYGKAGVKEYWIIEYDDVLRTRKVSRIVYNMPGSGLPIGDEDAKGVMKLATMDLSVNFDEVFEPLDALLSQA
jgi:Uma2 family endonuclease